MQPRHAKRQEAPKETYGKTGSDAGAATTKHRSGLECYLAELYVTPARRGDGLGRALMEAAIEEARTRGADTMEIGVDEPDQGARRLYERLGFTNRTGDADDAVMYVYERDLNNEA